ncbi:hypothetical protein K505DRAFT_334311 [Melanomma pulvis-pyrius CBS 109.77]|uniref:Uncharacterized protein n=1 Tax=Melanomma pulvis-pyrius CBS 109.77 TaxID=1314802 RepID=A0A6A6XLP4_9PLEO|nr:hypothetical protein K505DRAFT_334311 [Melanomma pulvis-pyrius CBS 109.77]
MSSSTAHTIGYQLLTNLDFGFCKQVPYSAPHAVQPEDNVHTGKPICLLAQGLGGVVAASIAQTIFTNSLYSGAVRKTSLLPIVATELGFLSILDMEWKRIYKTEVGGESRPRGESHVGNESRPRSPVLPFSLLVHANVAAQVLVRVAALERNVSCSLETHISPSGVVNCRCEASPSLLKGWDLNAADRAPDHSIPQT